MENVYVTNFYVSLCRKNHKYFIRYAANGTKNSNENDGVMKRMLFICADCIVWSSVSY